MFVTICLSVLLPLVIAYLYNPVQASTNQRHADDGAVHQASPIHSCKHCSTVNITWPSKGNNEDGFIIRPPATVPFARKAIAEACPLYELYANGLRRRRHLDACYCIVEAVSDPEG